MRLLVLPVAEAARPPKGEDVAAPAESKVIIALESERSRPAKFTRSGQPFQIWKAPPDLSETREQRPRPFFLQEMIRYYARAIDWLSTARFRHSQ